MMTLDTIIKDHGERARHLEFCKCPFSHFRDVFIPDRESKAYDDS